ncbi:MAG: hypothetical protein JOZ36_15345 [Acidobacteria bacterium]|nr:hypothetical protein [Acidobacteriota bacterium]
MTATNSHEAKIYLSMAGLPLRVELNWPFHKSTSGSDWWVLHGTIWVETTEGLHALVAVNLTTTVKEIMPSLAPIDAEAPVINTLRKEVDHKQVEFQKKAKLLPIQFSSRHYDFKRNYWVFGKASDEEICLFLKRKLYWHTRLMGEEVSILDATDAQYLDTTTQHMGDLAGELARQGLIKVENGYAIAREKLMSEADRFEADQRNALAELERKHAFERG